MIPEPSKTNHSENVTDLTSLVSTLLLVKKFYIKFFTINQNIVITCFNIEFNYCIRYYSVLIRINKSTNVDDKILVEEERREIQQALENIKTNLLNILSIHVSNESLKLSIEKSFQNNKEETIIVENITIGEENDFYEKQFLISVEFFYLLGIINVPYNELEKMIKQITSKLLKETPYNSALNQFISNNNNNNSNNHQQLLITIKAKMFLLYYTFFWKTLTFTYHERLCQIKQFKSYEFNELSYLKLNMEG